MKQTTSRKGRAFLSREEGLVPYAYNDPVGHCTFGVGHLIHLGNCRRSDLVKWGSKSFHPLGFARARRRFKHDLRPFERAVRIAAVRELPQHKFDALVSLAFNIGAAGFLQSTVADRVGKKAGENAVAEGFRMWDNPAILRPRREREIKLYTRGLYR